MAAKDRLKKPISRRAFIKGAAASGVVVGAYTTPTIKTVLIQPAYAIATPLPTPTEEPPPSTDCYGTLAPDAQITAGGYFNVDGTGLVRQLNYLLVGNYTIASHVHAAVEFDLGTYFEQFGRVICDKGRIPNPHGGVITPGAFIKCPWSDAVYSNGVSAVPFTVGPDGRYQQRLLIHGYTESQGADGVINTTDDDSGILISEQQINTVTSGAILYQDITAFVQSVAASGATKIGFWFSLTPPPTPAVEGGESSFELRLGNVELEMAFVTS